MAKATGPTYKLAFKRRRLNLTNYRKRLALLKSGLPRFVVRKTNRNILVQCIGFTPNHDEVIARADASELAKYGWKQSANLPSAYLVGFMCAKRALAAGKKSVVLDSGLHTPSKGSFLFACVKGAIDAGLEIPVGEIEFDEERISGKHISDYAKQISGTEKYNKLFSQYLKKGIKPEEINSVFEKVKEQISKENFGETTGKKSKKA
ncbi:MAG: 50S ribosomal protein L18 [Candidatus Micrarchaeia archaeon]